MRNPPEIGELVVVNDLPDATLYRVKLCVMQRGSFYAGLIDSQIEGSRPNQSVNWIDIDCLQKPTKQQLENNR